MKPIACKYSGITCGVPLFTLEEPIEGHPAGSTVSETTINAAGRFILYPVGEIEMLRKICDDRAEINYILSGIKRAENLLGQIVNEHTEKFKCKQCDFVFNAPKSRCPLCMGETEEHH